MRSSGSSGVSAGSLGLDGSVVSVGSLGSVVCDSVLSVGSVGSVGAAGFVDSEVLGVVVEELGCSSLSDVVGASDSLVSEVAVSLDDGSVVSSVVSSVASSLVGVSSEVDGCSGFSP